jgi:Asp/Glu/hydantoin racemase
MAMRIWHQSFTALENLPAYEAVLQAHMQRVCRPDTEVVLHGLHPDTYRTRTAHRSIDIRYGYLLNLHANQFVLAGLAAARDGYDAYAVSTIPDAGLQEVRSLVQIPAVGYGEASMHVACMLGQRFGILNFIRELAPMLEDNVRRYGLQSRLAGVRHVGFTFKDVLPAFEQPAPLIERFEEAARGMIRDGADVIIPGEVPLCVLLASQGINRVDNVPILDALTVTMKMAELFVDLWRVTGVRPSRDNYFTASPPLERVMELVRFYGLDRLMRGEAE